MEKVLETAGMWASVSGFSLDMTMVVNIKHVHYLPSLILSALDRTRSLSSGITDTLSSDHRAFAGFDRKGQKNATIVL